MLQPATRRGHPTRQRLAGLDLSAHTALGLELPNRTHRETFVPVIAGLPEGFVDGPAPKRARHLLVRFKLLQPRVYQVVGSLRHDS